MFKFIEAKSVNDIVDPSTTLGIEITDKDVAACCRLGNLDGQHGTGQDWIPARYATAPAMPISWQDKAAIEIAMLLDWDACLWCDDPHSNSRSITGCDLYNPLRGYPTTLATTRPDVDSIGAMAVLVLRALGLAVNVEFVKTIAKADSFRVDKWMPRPLPTEENPWPSGTTTVDSTQSLAAFGMICSPRPNDRTRALSLAQRVYIMAIRMIATEALIEFGKTAPYGEEYFRLSDASRGELRLAETLGIHPIIDGQTAVRYIGGVHDDVHKARQALARAAHEPGALVVVLSSPDGGMLPRLDIARIKQFAYEHLAEWPGRTAFVEVRVAHAGALSLGYCLAPVVVAFDQSNKGKVTIAAYTDGHLDAAGLTAELNRLEEAAGGTPKWGGPRNMCCSPSHVGTRIAEETISEAVSRFVVRQ